MTNPVPDWQTLRRQHPEFIYRDYSWHLTGSQLHCTFEYALPPVFEFHHEIIIRLPPEMETGPVNENLIFHLGLSEMFSYWKSTCSPQINISAGFLSPGQIAFWHKLFLKGMGEYFYRNHIDFTSPDFLNISASGSPVVKNPPVPLRTDRVLVPVGGGKDSIVTVQLLRPRFSLTPFVVNPVPVITSVIKTAQLPDPVTVERVFDPLLFELNHRGFLNGHVPVSAFYAFAALTAAALTGHQFIAFSNEKSSVEGNTTYLGHVINHQYSKTLEFETDLADYISDHLKLDLKNFSFLRPLFELQITRLFSAYSQFFSVFTSCNNNFKMDPSSHPSGSLWCKHCPKCVSTALLLAPFIGEDKVTGIMGAFPPRIPGNRGLMDELTGAAPVKPFECVLTRAEASAAWDRISTGSSGSFSRLLSSWTDNPNMPEKFAKILTSAL